jgi:hypothetical protein
MPYDKLPEGIAFNDIRINSITSGSGVFAGYNVQYNWNSEENTQIGFGTVLGEENVLENPCNVVTDSESSSEMLEYFKVLVDKKFGR